MKTSSKYVLLLYSYIFKRTAICFSFVGHFEVLTRAVLGALHNFSSIEHIGF